MRMSSGQTQGAIAAQMTLTAMAHRATATPRPVIQMM